VVLFRLVIGMKCKSHDTCQEVIRPVELTLNGIMAQASVCSISCLCPCTVVRNGLVLVPTVGRLCLAAEGILCSPDDMGECVGRTNGLKRGVVRTADKGLDVGRASVPAATVEGTAAGEVRRASFPVAADGVLTNLVGSRWYRKKQAHGGRISCSQ
jgi:hypothetical protein